MWWRYLIAVCIGVLIGFLITPTKQVESNKELEKSLNALDMKLDSISNRRDTIIQLIDSSKTHLKVIEHWYEKKYINVTTQSVDSDCVFFREYLSNYK